MNWDFFSRITAIIGIVWQVVQMIEQVLIGQPGARKKEAVTKVVAQTLSEAGAPLKDNDGEIVSRAIDKAVGVFNDFGVFSHPLTESTQPEYSGEDEEIDLSEKTTEKPVKEKKGK